MVPNGGRVRTRVDATEKARKGQAAPAKMPPVASRRRPVDLTPREQEVLQLIWAGLTNRGISAHLCISVNTGETHRANMMKKLGVSNMAQLLKRALEKGLLPHPAEDR